MNAFRYIDARAVPLYAAKAAHGAPGLAPHVVSQRRMQELNRGSKDGLEVSPNLWAGVGLVRGGAGTALVGSHEEVADRIEEYHDLGIDEFIFSGYPNLEETFWFGEGVMPILRSRGLLQDAGDRVAVTV